MPRPATDHPTVETVPDRHVEVGAPVRLEWLAERADPPWLAHDHPGLTTEHTTGYHGEPQTRHTSVVVPLRVRTSRPGGWSEPGADDEFDLDCTVAVVRPATPQEAAPLLAEEERDATTHRLLDRLDALTRGLDQADGEVPDPDLSHVDMSDEHEIRAGVRAEYADARVADARRHRHLRTLDGHLLARPGNNDHGRALLHPDPDPDRGVVWLDRGHHWALRCYRLHGELADIVDELTPLLPFDAIGDRRSLTRDQVAELFGADGRDLDDVLAAYHLDPLTPGPGRPRYEGQDDGQIRYPRARTLNAHRHLEHNPGHVREQLRRERERHEQPQPRTRRARCDERDLRDELRHVDVRDW
ncbi:hypothetical protein [Saccharothrix sp. HUAS TT1]|uniref:hypothetical protein n=1 Tax=unclassified Saccharothrix TaxID=2593673 RepID=UPI00345B63A9